MTMTRRFVDHGIRILAAVALLMAVISSPIRPTGLSYTAPSPNFRPRNLAMLKIWHSGQLGISARPCLREADSLQSQIEDELDADIEDEVLVASPPAPVAFELLASPRAEPCSERVRFAVPLAARPLRC
jgi:hypothetical protein